jgi:pimeloyl-ACP methyl ester carboxylesterase
VRTDSALDRELEVAQAALIERHAPDTRVGRLRWSGGETQVLELGTGSPLLLVHGAMGAALQWVPILPALARNHRVLAVDLPGHGLADPFDYAGVDLLELARTFLHDIVDALELPTVDVTANSLGGLWSVVFALDTPDRVARLVLVGAPAGVNRAVPLQLRILALPLIGQPLGRLVMSKPTRDGNRKVWGEVLVRHPERLDDALLDADVASQRRNIGGSLSLMRCIGGARGMRRRFILGERWQALTVPTMFLWGEGDRFFRGPEEGEAIAATNSNLHLTRIPDAGHLAWSDDPERVVNEIERFLGTTGELPGA